jgi:uncharacterized protein (TIRG00374 family)
MTEEATPKRRFRIPRQVRRVLSLGVLIFIFEYLVIPQFGTAKKSLHLLNEVNPVLLLLAVLVEAAAIASYSELTRAVFTPHALKRFETNRINLSTLALSHVLPGGTAPASALSYRLFSEAGVPASTNAFGLAVQGSGSAVVLNIIFWIALVISIPLRGFNPAYGFAALAGVFLMLAFFGTIALLTRGQHKADAWLRATVGRLPRVKPETISRLLTHVAERITMLTSNQAILWTSLGWAAANWLLDATSLWIFVYAFGYPLSPIDLLVAFGLANVLAVVPITPAGLGLIEFILIPTIVGFGVPHQQATLAVLAYRFVNFWLPIPIGGAAYLSLEWRRGKAQPLSG